MAASMSWTIWRVLALQSPAKYCVDVDLAEGLAEGVIDGGGAALPAWTLLGLTVEDAAVEVEVFVVESCRAGRRRRRSWCGSSCRRAGSACRRSETASTMAGKKLGLASLSEVIWGEWMASRKLAKGTPVRLSFSKSASVVGW